MNGAAGCIAPLAIEIYGIITCVLSAISTSHRENHESRDSQYLEPREMASWAQMYTVSIGNESLIPRFRVWVMPFSITCFGIAAAAVIHEILGGKTGGIGSPYSR